MMQMAIASFRLKAGTTEADMLEASDTFQREFVATFPGVKRRVVVRKADGSYADVVLFEDMATVQAVLAAEQSSEVCASLFSLLEDDGAPTVFEVLQVHEQ